MRWFLLSWFLVCGVDGGGAEASTPRNVVAVELHADARAREIEEWTELISIELGEPLDAREVRRTLRNLHAAGAASEIEIYTEPRGEASAAIIVLRRLPRIAEVRLEGELGERLSLVRKQLLVRPGDRLLENRLLLSVFALQDFYGERGYLDAEVMLDVSSLEADRFDVVFAVDAGLRSSFGKIDIRGMAPAIDVVAGRKVLEARPGKSFRRPLIVEDRERLQRFLIAEGFRTATVALPIETPVPESGVIDALFEVSSGPFHEVVITGASQRELQRKDLLPFLGDGGYDEALVLQAVSRIERHFQSKGYYRVQVQWQEERSEEKVRLGIDIDPGRVFSLDRVDLMGNESIDGAILRELMVSAPKDWKVPGSGRLIASVLAADLDNLRSFYRLQGFLDVELGPPIVVEEEDSLAVEIAIVEGKRRRVVSVRLDGPDGVDASDEEALLGLLPLQAGGAFHQRLLEDSQAILRIHYLQDGFAEAQVRERLDWDADGRLVDVVFEIDKGRRSEVGRTVIRGNRKTRARVVQRTLGLESGDALSSERLLEAQRRLYRLGLFSRVQIDVMSTPDDAKRRNVVVKLEEAPPRRVTYGFGYNSEEGFGGLLGWSHANVFGRAHSLSAEVRLTTSENQRFRLLYRQPTSGERLLPLQYMLFRFDEDRPGYEVSSSGSQIVASWAHRRLRWGVRQDYRLVKPFNITVPINEIERELQESQIASATVFLHFDARDHPVDTRSGTSTRFEAELARPLFSATAEYLKLFAEQSVYFDFQPWGLLAASLRLGAIEPLGDLDPGNDDDAFPPLPTATIPIVKRFFGGGRTTHRAFERDLLGIVGRTLSKDGEPTGGNGLVLINLDYRFPIAGPVEALVFVDAGNVWADWRDIDRDSMRFGAGIGARYMSPIGPLRLEMGWKLDRQDGEARSAVFLSFGDPF